MTQPSHPEVSVKLLGEDSNVYNLIGLVYKQLKRHGLHQEATDFTTKATSSNSYDEVLLLIMETVNVA